MKAAIFRGKGRIVIEEVEVPEVASDCVLVDTKATGICGSDIHRYYGDWGQPKSAAGHELVGIVEDVGEEVKRFKVGDRVCAECFSHCGECVFCKTGLYNLCDNRVYLADRGHTGFSEYSILHESSIFKLPREMSFETGAMVEPLAVSYRAFCQTNAGQKDTVAILGAGTIGLLCLAVAKASGVRQAIISAKYEHQAKMAEELGADKVIRVSEDDVVKNVKSISDGQGVDAVIDTVASSQTFGEALRLARKAGTICLVGGYTGELSLDLARVVWKELQLIGSNCYGYDGMQRDFEASIDLISSGKIKPTVIVTHRFPIEDIEEAFRIAADKRSGSIKVQIQRP
jgi:L-iditol 2-dehydrogenase